MEYQDTDEAIRRDACEKVKQIVKAIKAIKIKYYLNFSKISANDQDKYQKLEESLEKISTSHHLTDLKVALMQEVYAKYDGKDIKDMKQGENPEPNDILQACYGAVDAQKEALSRGRITQATRCQEKLKKYMKELDSVNYKEIINYKREKFAELVQSRENIEAHIVAWNKTMKNMFKAKHVEARKNAMEKIQKLQNKEINKIGENQIEMITI